MLFGTTILFCLFLILEIRVQSTQFMGMHLIFPDMLAHLLEDRTCVPYGDSVLSFHNTALPYDQSNNTLYFPQNKSEESWDGSLIAPAGYSAYILADDYIHDKASAIRKNHSFSVYLIGKTSYIQLNLIPTGMPVINIHTEQEIAPESIDYYVDPDKYVYESKIQYYGTIDIWDPVTQPGHYELSTARVKYHSKGATTSVFDKQSYSLHLKDENGKKQKLPLLGMRCDDDWKLNSLVTDRTRIREITASQLWNQFAAANTEINESGATMQYAELLLDNEYQGLYCLVEPVDAKKVALDENDYLYKSVDEMLPDTDAVYESIDNNWRIAQTLRIMYPDTISNYESAWYPLLNQYTIFRYYDPELYSFEHALSYVYLSNLCDRMLFNLAVSAQDNAFKNTYYAVDVPNDENVSGKAEYDYKVREIPWDLDFTFGNAYDYEADLFSVFDTDYTHVYTTPVMKQLLFFSTEETLSELLPRWNGCRKTFLSTENVLSMLNANEYLLTSTGALLREQDRWPEYQVTSDIQDLLVFQQNRLDWLDSYMLDGIELLQFDN